MCPARFVWIGDGRTRTTGAILCEHVKAVDLRARGCEVVERLPEVLLQEVIATVFCEIELQP